MAAAGGDLVVNGVLTPVVLGQPNAAKPDTDTLTNILVYPKAGNNFTGCQVYFEATYDGTNWFPVAAYDQAQNAWLPGLVLGVQAAYPVTDNASRGFQVQSAGYSGVRVRPSAVVTGVPSCKLSSASFFASNPVSTGTGSAGSAGVTNETYSELVELRKLFLCLCDMGQLDAESIRIRAIWSITDDFAVMVPPLALTGNPSGSPM